MRETGQWGQRFILVAFGCVAALFAIEGLLRAGGLLFQSRVAAGNRASLESSDGTIRILCLGESTTAGLAGAEGPYPLQLERILNERAGDRTKFRVFNGGEVATSSDVIVAKLADRLEKFNPHIVVAMMGINDGPLSDPAFQVGGSLRVWKLAKMLYHSHRAKRPKPLGEQADELEMRATRVLRNWPTVAADLAEQLTRLAPDDPRGFVILAQAQQGLGQGDRAVESFAKAIEVDASAVVAYAHDVPGVENHHLDKALARFDANADALGARAILALRRGAVRAAKEFARRLIALDPENVVGLLVDGHMLLNDGLNAEATSRFELALAVDPRLVQILATRPLVGSPALRKLVASESVQEPSAPAESGAERWFRRGDKDRQQRYRFLGLRGAWQRTARGEVERATEDLRAITEFDDEEDAPLRLRAFGQLAVVAWQAGDADQAEYYHQQIEDYLDRSESPVTRKNYMSLWRELHERGIQMVAMQYPMRPLAPLQRLLSEASDVVLIDNEHVFKRALLGRPYTEIFVDLFAGDFGHATVEGNRLIAENVADTILTLVAVRDGYPSPPSD
jgi:tetratricopeptide (TPR) repeat protein